VNRESELRHDVTHFPLVAFYVQHFFLYFFHYQMVRNYIIFKCNCKNVFYFIFLTSSQLLSKVVDWVFHDPNLRTINGKVIWNFHVDAPIFSPPGTCICSYNRVLVIPNVLPTNLNLILKLQHLQHVSHTKFVLISFSIMLLEETTLILENDKTKFSFNLDFFFQIVARIVTNCYAKQNNNNNNNGAYLRESFNCWIFVCLLFSWHK